MVLFELLVIFLAFRPPFTIRVPSLIKSSNSTRDINVAEAPLAMLNVPTFSVLSNNKFPPLTLISALIRSVDMRPSPKVVTKPEFTSSVDNEFSPASIKVPL